MIEALGLAVGELGAVDDRSVGLDNPNEIFVATQEPYGLIEAVITR